MTDTHTYYNIFAILRFTFKCKLLKTLVKQNIVGFPVINRETGSAGAVALQSVSKSPIFTVSNGGFEHINGHRTKRNAKNFGKTVWS